MKYFVISDIHAHFNAMISALKNKNFNPDKNNNHLLVLGDLFDRGNQAKEVLEYLYPLSKKNKATIILGNHDSFLLEFLNGDNSNVMFNAYYNGFGATLYSLSGIKLNSNNINKIRDVIEEKYPYLKEWLDSFPLYLELDKYIFVHGGIDGSINNWQERLNKHDFIWSYENELPPVQGKIVVAGHKRIPTIKYKNVDYYKLFRRKPEAFDILYLDNKILIDRFVEVSNELNVLILEINK